MPDLAVLRALSVNIAIYRRSSYFTQNAIFILNQSSSAIIIIIYIKRS